ncbi:hypothetical protein BKA58DRAFT_467743 [Alternaria rosae]|uniref:uncharacterized protein n=1 Tax=Alternaria rosae TaxID=1187941 RepID=UPI001E8D4776|nr:uncharacterized protein BKA58DRAFT_467743 [Alternaria rosae]KAH6876042.1 hypothetical protein BKA58DRAFT_467743 [Alternaria rosae]
MAERRLNFNVSELKNAAAKALNRSVSDVNAIQNIAEDGFNRILNVTMNNGSSVLARLPYSSTLPRCLAVASEVATLDFLRTNGIPAPFVLAYSSGENAFGVEYMLMERIPGKPLSGIWLSLAEEERCRILHRIVLMETKLFANTLPACGSIYYSQEMPPGMPRIGISGSSDLCVGPYASMRWWYEERAELDVDRGPHVDPQLVLRSHAEKELARIRKYGRPRHPFYREYAESFGYKKHFEVLPAFLAADIPMAFADHADEGYRSFTEPKLPKNLASTAEKECAEAEELYRRRHIHFWYLGLTQVLNKPH